jgi:hypothetical protein
MEQAVVVSVREQSATAATVQAAPAAVDPSMAALLD